MRRTKEEAARTRAAIVEAARRTFGRHGLAHATLDQVAAEAGVSKGAIYWHFRGKRGLFQAVREAVSLPLLDRADTALLDAGAGPALGRVGDFLRGFLDAIEGDRRTRETLALLHYRCEYVGELAAELDVSRRNLRRLASALERAFEAARRDGSLNPRIAPRAASAHTLAFLTGLVRLWLLERGRGGIRGVAREALQAHLAGLASGQDR